MSFIVKVPVTHKELIQAESIRQEVFCSFYTMETNPELLQVEVHAEKPETLWYFATNYGMSVVNEIHKSVFGK
jgi:hypothetical protein